MKSIKNLLTIFSLAAVLLSSVSPVNATTRTTTSDTEIREARVSPKPPMSCEGFKIALTNRIQAQEKQLHLVVNKYNDKIVRLKAILVTFEDQGYPIDLINKVRADLSQLDTLVTKLKTDFEVALAKEKEVANVDCSTNPDVKALRLQVNAATQPVKEDLADIHSFVKNTLKPDILALLDAKPEASTR